MNSDQAKDILMLYRPGSADAQDPEFAEALALAGSDPDLGRWLDQHCAIQDTLRAKFRQIPVPEGLKEQIVSERKAHTVLTGRRKLAIAAVCGLSVLLLAGIGTLVLRSNQEATFANFQIRMIGTVARASYYPPMDLETNDSGRILQYLALSDAPGANALPAQLAKVTTTGCKILPWQGKSVSMICYYSGKNSNTNAPDLFLFVAKRADVRRAPASSRPAKFELRQGLATASWSSGDETYILAGVGDEPFLRGYF